MAVTTKLAGYKWRHEPKAKYFIVAADLLGYTAKVNVIMAHSGPEGVAAFKKRVNDCFSAALAVTARKARGGILDVDRAGDGHLLVCKDACDAWRYIWQLHAESKKWDAAQASIGTHLPMEFMHVFRTGVGCGQISSDQEHGVGGPSVNLANRLCTKSEGGQCVMHRDVYQALTGMARIHPEFLTEEDLSDVKGLEDYGKIPICRYVFRPVPPPPPRRAIPSPTGVDTEPLLPPIGPRPAPPPGPPQSPEKREPSAALPPMQPPQRSPSAIPGRSRFRKPVLLVGGIGLVALALIAGAAVVIPSARNKQETPPMQVRNDIRDGGTKPPPPPLHITWHMVDLGKAKLAPPTEAKLPGGFTPLMHEIENAREAKVLDPPVALAIDDERKVTKYDRTQGDYFVFVSGMVQFATEPRELIWERHQLRARVIGYELESSDGETRKVKGGHFKDRHGERSFLPLKLPSGGKRELSRPRWLVLFVFPLDADAKNQLSDERNLGRLPIKVE